MLLGVTLASLCSAGAFGQQKPVRRPLASLDGPITDVTVCPRTGACSAAQSQQAVSPGSNIRTSATSARVVFQDGTRMILSPRTEVQLQEPMDVTLDMSGAVRSNRVDLKKGDVDIEIPITEKRPLLVVGPHETLAAYRNAHGRVAVQDGELSALLHDGRARVASQGRWVSLPPFHRVTLKAGGKVTTPAPLAAAPAFSPGPCRATTKQPCAIAVVTGHDTAPLGVSWTEIESATGYRVKIARSPAMNDLILDEVAGAEQRNATTPALPPGRYWVTLQALMSNGLETRVSDPRPMRVVRLVPEKGVTVVTADNALVFPNDRSVAIEDPDGIEASFGIQSFFRAPTSIQYRPQSLTNQLALRVLGDQSDSVVFRLEPRSLAAHVDLSPMTAMWPNDPISVRVALSDPTGRLSADHVSPNIGVQVNGNYTNISFTRKGNLWIGTIPPRGGSGPWVIRVRVRDEDGYELGRGVLEVVGTRPVPLAPGRVLLW